MNSRPRKGPLQLSPCGEGPDNLTNQKIRRMIRIKEESRKDKKKEDTYPLAPSVSPALSFRALPVVALVGKEIIGKEEE